ncbi:MAG: hypothetical protein C0621_04215, partial [Desulfuromonas sp.]
MSSILKALRKLEEEKSRQQPGGGDIGHSILRGGTRRQVGSSALLWGGVGGVLLIVALGLGWWLGGRTNSEVTTPVPVALSEKVSEATAEPEKRVARVEEMSSAVVAPVAKVATVAVMRHQRDAEVVEEAMPDEVVVDQAVVASSLAPVPQPKMAVEPVAEVTQEAPLVSQPALSTELPEAQVVEPTVSEGAGVVTTREVEAVVWPDLTIAAIAYTDDPEGRLAVVNDLPVMQGTEIDGVLVEMIGEDEVTFLYGGESRRIPF